MKLLCGLFCQGGHGRGIIIIFLLTALENGFIIMKMVRLESQSNHNNWSGAGVSSPRGSGRTSRFLAFFGDCQMKRIPLTQGEYAIVDDEDYEWLRQWKWFAKRDKNTFYAARLTGKWPKQKTIRMHRQILNVPSNFEVDHVNHNGLDNRRCNIRICTSAQNHHNQLPYKNHSSQYKGVYWSKAKKKWHSSIHSNRKRIHIGYCNNEIDAAKAYDAKAKELFGEFALTNAELFNI